MKKDYVNKFHFGSVRVLVAANKSAASKITLNMLHEAGFTECTFVSDMEEVETFFAKEEIDLFIYDEALARDELNKMIHEIRNGKVGSNPFLTVMAMVSDTTKETVMECINSGVDTVILKPYSRHQFSAHLWHAIEHRRDFIVTTDYTGPDRHKNSRSEGQSIPTIEVPNVLLSKLNSAYNAVKVRKHTGRAMAAINEQKMLRHAFQIGWLAEKAAPLYASASEDQTRIGYVAAFKRTADDMNSRLFGVEDAHAKDVCVSAMALANKFHQNPLTPDAKDVEEWSKLATELKSIKTWYVSGATGINQEAPAQKEVQNKVAVKDDATD